MRKTTLVTIFVVVVLSIGGYIYLTEPFNPDRGHIQDLSEQFMEDLQYKDFYSSARYHHELEQERVDIGKAIEDLFMIDPELLDILDYRITRTEIDSSGTRARVLVNTRFRPLKPKAMRDDDGDDIEEADLQLYWMQRHPDCPLGTDCEQGQCVDDAGRPAEKENADDDQDGDDGETQQAATFECDQSLEHQWFMNLDSTLEGREYR